MGPGPWVSVPVEEMKVGGKGLASRAEEVPVPVVVLMKGAEVELARLKLGEVLEAWPGPKPSSQGE